MVRTNGIAVDPALRTDWRRVSFGEMAESVTERVDDPSLAGVERYVGLEHLDSGSFKISRWGSPDDVIATKLRFKPGDIIFGRRRAYQRKVAVADFEGICSAHALVLRARENVVSKDFLPFFMQSDTFFERALAISVGSLSPTINWKTLARQEFALPPKPEQERIAALFWATEDAFIKFLSVQEELRRVREAVVSASISSAQLKAEIAPLRECARIQTGLALGKRVEGPSISLPYLRVANVQDGWLDLSEIKTVQIEESRRERYSLHSGDVLLTEGGDFDKLGRGCVWRGEVPSCLHQNHIFAVRTDNSRLLPDYLLLLTSSYYGKRYFLSCAKRTTNLASINSTQLGEFPVLLLSLDAQREVLEAVRTCESSIRQAKSHISQIWSLKDGLVTSLLRPNETG